MPQYIYTNKTGSTFLRNFYPSIFIFSFVTIEIRFPLSKNNFINSKFTAWARTLLIYTHGITQIEARREGWMFGLMDETILKLLNEKKNGRGLNLTINYHLI